MGNRHRAVSMSFTGSATKDEEKKAQQSLSDLRSVYKDIRYDWPQLVQGETTPLELAIAFLDDTSVGLAHRKPEFDELCQHTAEILRSAVVENHDTFNNSVGLYHLLLSIAKDSQEDSSHIKDLIELSKRDMKDRSLYLKDLDLSSAKYSEMIEILDAMESLHGMPEQIEKLVSEKKIHQVYDVIAEGYKTAAKYNLWSLSAMNATQNALEMQSNNLYDMIVDELKNEIYLKNLSLLHQGKDSLNNLIQSTNPKTASFGNFLGQVTSLELYIYNSANLDLQDITESLTDSVKYFLESQLPKLHAHYSKHDADKIDYSILLEFALNTATESYYYMYMLLNTASKLNKLQQILHILATTIQEELHSLINQTIDEIKLKNFTQLARIAKAQTLEKLSALEKVSGQTFSDASVPILQDLFGTFFVKCLVVLLKHKIVSEIVHLIQARQNVATKTSRESVSEAPTATYSFNNVWTLMIGEINSLVISYIHDAADKRPQNKSDHGYSAGKMHQVMNKNRLFQFDDVSFTKSNDTLEKLNVALDEMFPGFLIGTEKSNSAYGNDTSPYITSERYNILVEVLVPKNVFNMRIILEFFLVFTAGSHQLFTDFDRTKSSSLVAYQFFNDVMKNSFLAKVRDELNQCLVECMSKESHSPLPSENANKLLDFQFDQTTVSIHEPSLFRKASNASNEEVYLNAVQFKQLFTHTCHAMNTSFAYRKDISDMVLGLLQNFTRSYEKFFNELLSTGGTQDITQMGFGLNGIQSKQALLLNSWIRTPALTEMSGGVLQFHDNPEECQAFLQKEIELMFYNSESPSKIFDISKEEFLDDEWFTQVCNCLLTASWILRWLPDMRKESNYSPGGSEGQKVSDVEKLKYDWSFLENGRSSYTTPEKLLREYLTLNLANVGEFDKVVEVFESIRDRALIALRYNIRLKALSHIGKSYRDNFVLPTEPADADQFVTLFNKELYYIGTKIHDILTVEENQCVFLGLPEFINRAFLQGSDLITIANGNGIKKILLNILTLQQMLRSVLKQQSSIDLSKASRYFELFTLSEHAFLQRVAENKEKYTKSEVLNLLRLVYSEKLALSNASSFNRTKFNELSRKINEVF